MANDFYIAQCSFVAQFYKLCVVLGVPVHIIHSAGTVYLNTETV